MTWQWERTPPQIATGGYALAMTIALHALRMNGIIAPLKWFDRLTMSGMRS